MPEYHVRTAKVVGACQRDLAFFRVDFFFAPERFAVDVPLRFVEVPRPVEAPF